MKSSAPPNFNSLFPILGYVVLYLLFPHKCRTECLIDGVICGVLSSVGDPQIQMGYKPSTITLMRTLIGGMMLGAVGFAFLVGEGDVTFSGCERRVPAPVGDLRGDEGGEVVLRRTSVLFATRACHAPRRSPGMAHSSCRGHLATGNCGHECRQARIVRDQAYQNVVTNLLACSGEV
jgi:hypothetical protein